MKAIDWTNIYKKYKGLWVALEDDEQTVIVAGKDAKKVWESAKKSYKDPMLIKVPEKLLPFIG